MSTSDVPGLRERKKQQTREALSWAALRLSVERGFGNVVVEDIAAEAGVSPRTFNNYFSSKAEAIVWRHVDRVRQIAGHLRERPADEPLWEAIAGAVTAPFEKADLPQPEWAAGVKLVLTDLALRSEFLSSAVRAEHECAMAIAERTRTDVERDAYPLLVAGAVGSAIRVAQQQWLRADPPASLASLLRDALSMLAAGLPDPSV